MYLRVPDQTRRGKRDYRMYLLGSVGVDPAGLKHKEASIERK